MRGIVVACDWRLIGPIAYLAFDIAVPWAWFAALGGPLPAAVLVLGYQVGYLADLAPLPGGIGALDGGLIGALVLYGANATTATAAVLLYHAIALAVPVLVGFVAFLLLPRALPDRQLRAAGTAPHPTDLGHGDLTAYERADAMPRIAR